jgi:hypothetical protein
LYGARSGEFRNPKLIVCVSAQGILRHQLLGNFPRKVPIDTTLDVDFDKLIELKSRTLAQLLALAREIRVFGIVL